MPALRPLLALCLLPACASAPVVKMSFDEAMGRAAPSARASVPPQPLRPRPALTPLDEALQRFSRGSRLLRQGVRRGSAMPPAQAARWEQVGQSLQAFLSRPLDQTPSPELIRARVILETELELDAATYGDFPAQLAGRVMGGLQQLAQRMALHRGDPLKGPGRLPGFAWPVDPVEISSPFGWRLHPVTGASGVHQGVDLVAVEGQLVSAAAAGSVLFAGWNGGHGRQVELSHPGGVVTRYSHLSQLLVEPGTSVARGDPLGLAGSTGSSTGAHLHFELLRDGRPFDPWLEFEPAPLAPPSAPSRGVGGP